MPQSSPSHARAPRLARTRAKVALILTINASRTDLGDEGYQLTVNANGAQVVAANRSGLLWGARTIEKAVRTGQGTVPAGSITDIPRFADRGATLCACGTHITPDWITRQIDRMPDLKMNYLSLELRIKSDKYPVAQQFSFDRIDEYMEAFGSTEWHMGADEFFFKQGPGDVKTYLAQIRSHYGAQMFWNTKTPKADGNAEAFKVRIKALGEPSTYVDPTRDTLAPGQYTIALSDGRALSVSGGTPTAGTASDNWELAATPDGYYQIRSVNANRCLAVYSEETPNSETHVSTTPGHPVTAYACADTSQEFTPTFQGDYATRNPQKWVAEPAEGGFRLRNAMTNQYLSVIDSGYLSRRPNGGEKTAEGTVAQLPLDVTVDSHSVFTLTSQASSALDVSIEREGDEAYPKTALSGMDRNSLPIVGDENWGETVLKVSVTNKGTTDATKIHLTPAVSNSWKLANGPQPIDRLAPGETRVVKFWARPTTEFGEATFTVTVTHSGEKTVASEGLIGVCGPRIEAAAVAADSVETRWERGKESMATDGDPATYWHSQYIDANKAKLPGTDNARK